MWPSITFVVDGTRVHIATHAVAIVVGVGAGGALAIRRSTTPGPVLLAIAMVASAVLVGSHALFATFHGANGTLWSGGLSSIGGVVAGLAAAPIAARLTGLSLGALLDRLVPASLLALAVGRVGCFLGGCCWGRPTTLPWGVVFPELGPPARHPLQLYSAAVDAGLVALLSLVQGPPGAVARAGLVGFGLVRTGLDVLRDPVAADPLLGGRVTLAQVAGVVLAIAAAWLRPRGPSTKAPGLPPPDPAGPRGA